MGGIIFLWIMAKLDSLMRRKDMDGFISTDDKKEVFFHITGVIDQKVLKENDEVSFDTESDTKGERAINIKIV